MNTELDNKLEEVCKIANELHKEFIESNKDTSIEKYLYELANYCSKLLRR